MSTAPATLKVTDTLRGPRFVLLDRALNGGDVIQLCCAGGWITGRFEWDAGMGRAPTFHFSIELAGGRVAEQAIEIPDGALLRWP